MLVKLLKDFMRGGKVKVWSHRGQPSRTGYKDTIVEVSDSTGTRWIQSGQAEYYEPPEVAQPKAKK